MGMGWLTLWPSHFTLGNDPVHIVQETGWIPGPIWTDTENLAPTWIQHLDCPACGKSLCWLLDPVLFTIAPYGHFLLNMHALTSDIAGLTAAAFLGYWTGYMHGVVVLLTGMLYTFCWQSWTPQYWFKHALNYSMFPLSFDPTHNYLLLHITY